MNVFKFPLLEYLLKQIVYQNAPRKANNKNNHGFISSIAITHP